MQKRVIVYIFIFFLFSCQKSCDFSFFKEKKPDFSAFKIDSLQDKNIKKTIQSDKSGELAIIISGKSLAPRHFSCGKNIPLSFDLHAIPLDAKYLLFTFTTQFPFSDPNYKSIDELNWVVFNVPVSSLVMSVSADILGEVFHPYGGPCPEAGAGEYVSTLTVLAFKEKISKQELSWALNKAIHPFGAHAVYFDQHLPKYLAKTTRKFVFFEP